VAPEALVVVGDPATPTPACLSAARRLTFAELRALRAPADPALVTPEPGDVAMIMYTSGTTGPSKGVLIPHGHCYLAGLGLAEATITNALGVIPEFIFRQPPTARDRDHRLRLMMAVPIAPEWGAAFEERFGVPFMQGFGMTECNIVAYTRVGDALVPGCAGYPLTDWFDVAVADPVTDALLPAGETGEIVVRPRVPGCVMAGYFRMPEKTVEAWRNLWFHTGDAGRFDEAGRLHYVDRIKDCIRRRGENISSFEIEQVLNAHPAVAESAVVGIKVAGAGGEDEVKAYVVPAAGASLDPVALLDWCAPRMPHFAVPRFVEVVTGELAKTPTGKLQKTPLREAGITAATWDRESIGYVVRR
jgi:crotonobetaine/carnitine-CoA ligase